MSSWFPSLVIFISLLSPLALASDDSFKAPDSLLLRDGRTIRGLIIKNSADSVLIQEEFGETRYLKSEIVRIRDEADKDVLFTDIQRKGDLPAWRVVANDLRTHDEIKSLVEIPATAIDHGEFKNVPYKSFRVNNDLELNIYGDPNDPSGLELGIYGLRSGNKKLRKVLRAYLAGFLTTREEIAALYSLDLNGGKRQVGPLTIEITPKTAPDAYGAWWISLYHLGELNALRLSPEEYARLTRPVDEVINRRGRLIGNIWAKNDIKKSRRLGNEEEHARVILRGFYRDKHGIFRLLTETGS